MHMSALSPTTLENQAARIAIVAAAVEFIGSVGPLWGIVLIDDEVVVELEDEKDIIVEGREARMSIFRS